MKKAKFTLEKAKKAVAISSKIEGHRIPYDKKASEQQKTSTSKIKG